MLSPCPIQLRQPHLELPILLWPPHNIYWSILLLYPSARYNPHWLSLCSCQLFRTLQRLSKGRSKILSFLGDRVLSLRASTCKIAFLTTCSIGNLKCFPYLATWFRSTHVVCTISISKINYLGQHLCLLTTFLRDNRSPYTKDSWGVCLK